MSKLRDMKVSEYLDILASNEPAPGGGSVAALSAAQGAALGIMVTELSIGRKKYQEHTEALVTARNQLVTMAQAFTEDIDRDTEAYQGVSAAMKLPKETPEQVTQRSQAIQQATLAATLVPLSVLKRCGEALVQISSLIGISNVNAVSDLGTGAAMLRGAAQGAWLNVLINISGLKDQEKVDALYAEAEPFYRDALRQADDIFTKVEFQARPAR